MPTRRRAKIVCTLGPAVDDEDSLAALFKAGMDAARLNLNYGTPELHIERIKRVREASERAGKHVAIIADIPGPKVRLGAITDNVCTLDAGDEVRFTVSDEPGNSDRLSVGEGFFHDGLITGDKVWLSDAVVEIDVTKVLENEVIAKVIGGGKVRSHTAVHLPSMFLRQGPITAADEPLLELAVQHDVDFIALTYVRDGADILRVREKLETLGRNIPLIAKIERHEAFGRLDSILERADAVMIRRGDLGASIEMSRVPLVQKDIVRRANNAGVPVIIATQMLGSMVEAPRPTRAEASDVSNAIVDGADGVLLSSETATGQYPVESIQMMDRIIVETERQQREAPPINATGVDGAFADTTACMACQAAVQCGAKLIACFTESGRTAGLVAKYRPRAPITALCEHVRAQRRLAIHWGVQAVTLEPVHDAERMVEAVDDRLLAIGQVQIGDPIVITYGAPVGEAGHTNSVRLHRVRHED